MEKLPNIYLSLFSGLCLLMSCIRVDVADCPPLQIILEVHDKNYANIKDAVTLGVMQQKDDKLPFREYVQTISFRVYNEQQNVVYSQPNQTVTGDDQKLKVELPASLPYGKYTVVAWGNRTQQSEGEKLSDEVKLEDIVSREEDIYLGSSSFDYQYKHEENCVELKRTKGKLLIMIENFPDVINHSTKNIEHIYSSVTPSWEYRHDIEKQTEYAWPERSNLVTQTLSAPSALSTGSLLKMRFEERKDNGDIDLAPAGIKQPEDVTIALERNALTIMKYQYNPDKGDFTILVYVNDEWQRVHSMEID